MKKVIINLKEKHHDEFFRLKKSFYDATTKEKILSLALTNGIDVESNTFQQFYDSYKISFEIYDNIKNEFYREIVSKYEEEGFKTWEVQFDNEDLIFYA